MDASTLRGLRRESKCISHLAEVDKDLVMKEKDERFPKTVTKPKDAKSGQSDSESDGAG
jgi:hypothetical protein